MYIIYGSHAIFNVVVFFADITALLLQNFEASSFKLFEF